MRACKWCGRLFGGHGNKKYCSPECRRKGDTFHTVKYIRKRYRTDEEFRQIFIRYVSNWLRKKLKTDKEFRKKFNAWARRKVFKKVLNNTNLDEKTKKEIYEVYCDSIDDYLEIKRSKSKRMTNKYLIGIIMREIYGYSFLKISKILNLKPKTLRRNYEKFKKRWGE